MRPIINYYFVSLRWSISGRKSEPWKSNCFLREHFPRTYGKQKYFHRVTSASRVFVLPLYNTAVFRRWVWLRFESMFGNLRNQNVLPSRCCWDCFNEIFLSDSELYKVSYIFCIWLKELDHCYQVDIVASFMLVSACSWRSCKLTHVALNRLFLILMSILYFANNILTERKKKRHCHVA